MSVSLILNPRDVAVVASTRDKALIWKIGVGAEDFPIQILPPVEIDHRHKRTGQFQRGHDSAHRFPEYFEDVAKSVREIDGILILGHGKGNSSYSELLIKYLEKYHPEIASKVLKILVVDISRMTNSELKNVAREWLEENYRKLAT